MKLVLAALFTTALLSAISVAQDPPQSPGTAPAPQSTPGQTAPNTPPNASEQGPRIAPGSIIPVQLSKTIDAKKVKTGDTVEAKVTMDLKTNSGETIVPKDTKVVGTVTEAQARDKQQPQSHVTLNFDHAVMKSGDLRMPMSIQAIIAPPSQTVNNADTSAPSAGGTPTPSNGGMAPTAGGAAANTGPGGSVPAQPPQTASSGGTTDQSQQSNRPPITSSTQGVIGISNLSLAQNSETSKGSVVSSEKNNVKIESGTLMLLRVQ